MRCFWTLSPRPWVNPEAQEILSGAGAENAKIRPGKKNHRSNGPNKLVVCVTLAEDSLEISTMSNFNRKISVASSRLVAAGARLSGLFTWHGNSAVLVHRRGRQLMFKVWVCSLMQCPQASLGCHVASHNEALGENRSSFYWLKTFQRANRTHKCVQIISKASAIWQVKKDTPLNKKAVPSSCKQTYKTWYI